MTDQDLAAAVAEAAGRLLLANREQRLLDGAALGRAGDRIANSFILAALGEWRPQDGVLSEESIDDPARLKQRRVWIVDPLDGTREYSERRSDWAVHVALSIDGRPALGAVALPARGLLYRSDRVEPPRPSSGGRLRMVVSRTRPPADAAAIAAVLDADLIDIGSAGAKAMAVVSGEADLYYHAGGQYEWDNCAPAAVALGAGLHASRADGSPLVYNNADTLLPDLLIARPEIADRVLALRRAGA